MFKDQLRTLFTGISFQDELASCGFRFELCFEDLELVKNNLRKIINLLPNMDDLDRRLENM